GRAALGRRRLLGARGREDRDEDEGEEHEEPARHGWPPGWRGGMPGAGKDPPTMQRVDGPGSVNGMFVGGNPTIGVDGTVVTAPWANDVQEEIAAVIEGEGIALAT